MAVNIWQIERLSALWVAGGALLLLYLVEMLYVFLWI